MNLKDLFKKKDKAESEVEETKDEAIDTSETKDASEEAKTEPEKAPVKKRKKKNEQMRSVLKDSVVESVVDEMKQLERFSFKKDGKNIYLGLYLNTDDIGGISKKQAKDEAKGSIVEQINGSKIRVLITPQMMDDECIIFIPDALTLSNMEEYTLLSEAPYTLAYVYDDGTVEDSKIKTNLSIFSKYATSDATISDFLQEHGIKADENEDEKKETEENTEEKTEGNIEEKVEEVSEGEEAFGGESQKESEEYDEGSANFDPDYLDKSDYDDIAPEDAEMTNDEELADDLNEDYEEDEPEEEIEYDEDDLAKQVKRTFYSDDLDLTISTDDFDVQYMGNFNLRPFEENRGEGWLNEYLTVLSQNANDELDMIHKQNLQNMRNLYIELMTEYCEKIQEDLNYKDLSTDYGEFYKKLGNTYDSEKQKMAQIVIDRRAEINKAWQETLKNVGENARIAAEAQHNDRYGRQHSEELTNVDSVVRNEVEAKYNKDLKEFHGIRRNEAHKRLDLGILEVLKKINEQYKPLLEQENDLYKKHQGEMVEFIKENRESDIANANVLAEELRQNEKADKVMSEMNLKLQTQADEYELRRQTILNELEDVKESRNTEVAKLKAQYENNIADLKEQLEQVRSDYQNAVKDLTLLDDKKKAEYSAKLTSKDEEKEELKEQLSMYEAKVRRNGTLGMLLGIVGIIAALFAGLVFGMRSGREVGEQNVRHQIEQQVEQRLEQRIDSKDMNTKKDTKVTDKKNENKDDKKNIKSDEKKDDKKDNKKDVKTEDKKDDKAEEKKDVKIDSKDIKTTDNKGGNK